MEEHDTKRNRSGQILIFGAIIIMLLVFSTAIAIHLSSTTYQSLRYSEMKELVQNSNEDLRRAMRNILADMTQEYNQTAQINPCTTHAIGNITFWMKTAIRTLASWGAQINFTVDQNLLQLNWYSQKKGSSLISAKYSMDIPSLGFYGWSDKPVILLNMTIFSVSVYKGAGHQPQRIEINFMINREGGIAVEDLGKTNFKVLYCNTSYLWSNGTIDTLYNHGGGNYTLYFLADKGELLSECFIFQVQDTRGIIVQCYDLLPTRTTTLLSTNTAKPGETIYDTANITFVVPGSIPPFPNYTGNVDFYYRYSQGSNNPWIPLGTKSLLWNSTSKCLIAISDDRKIGGSWAGGNYDFQAIYSGDSNYITSNSNITDTNKVPNDEVLFVDTSKP